MLVKNIEASTLLPNSEIDFQIDELELLNMRGVAATVEDINTDNPEAQLGRQTNVLGAKASGSINADSDKSILQISIGQSVGLTWSLNIIPQSTSDTEFECQFFVPPTSFFVTSRLLPIPVKSACIAGKEDM